MIKKMRELDADTVVLLVFLILFMVAVSVQIAETRLTNVALVSNVVSHPWKTPVLNKKTIVAYDCVRQYSQPPSWVCHWSGNPARVANRKMRLITPLFFITNLSGSYAQNVMTFGSSLNTENG